MGTQQQAIMIPSQDILDRIGNTRRFMVKIGSNKIVCTEQKIIHQDWLNEFADHLIRLKTEKQKEFAITSSGAIGLARVIHNLPVAQNIAQKQAYAAFGQGELTAVWKQAFAAHRIIAGQVLLTKRSLLHPDGHNNTRSTMQTIREIGGIVIANENDTVATDEIRFGDNDQLSAYGAIADQADTLILVTDVDGLYTADPRKNQNAEHIPVMYAATEDLIRAAGGPNGDHSCGGMSTKLEAARIASRAYIDTFIIDGNSPDCLAVFFNGQARCTYIHHTAFDAYRNDPRTLAEIASSRTFTM